jgi:anti-sigma factor RsiW
MNHCTEMEATLNDHLDGLLDGAAAARADAHLRECRGCRAALSEMRDLQASARRLPREVEAPVELWPELAAKLPSGSGRSVPVWGAPRAWALAAGLAGVAVLVALTLKLPMPPPASTPAPASTAALEAFFAAEDLYRQAGQQLLAALEAADPGLPAAARTTIENNLALIDASIRDVRSALERHPERPEHGYRLVELFRRRLGLLEQTTQILRGHAGSPIDQEESL